MIRCLISLVDKVIGIANTNMICHLCWRLREMLEISEGKDAAVLLSKFMTAQNSVQTPG